MTKFYQNRDFKNLQRSWYKKLSESGFKDQERFFGGDMILKSDTERLSRFPAANEGRAEYYRIADLFLHELSSEDDYAVWELHTQGEGRRKISKRLGVSEGKIRKRLEKLTSRMMGWWEEEGRDEYYKEDD